MAEAKKTTRTTKSPAEAQAPVRSTAVKKVAPAVTEEKESTKASVNKRASELGSRENSLPVPFLIYQARRSVLLSFLRKFLALKSTNPYFYKRYVSIRPISTWDLAPPKVAARFAAVGASLGSKKALAVLVLDRPALRYGAAAVLSMALSRAMSHSICRPK